LLKDDDAVKIETKEAKMKPYVIEMGRKGHIYIYIYIYIVNNVMYSKIVCHTAFSNS
jgi:hypothetical protein